MTFRTLNLCFPLVLAVHNAEEYLCGEPFPAGWPIATLQNHLTRRVFCNALLLLTASATLTSVATYLSQDKRLLTVSRAATFALLLNALGHGATSLVRQRWQPGTISAVGLVLPYSIAAIMAMRIPHRDMPRFLLRSGILGAVTLPLSTAGFLSISYGLSRLERYLQD